MFRQLDVPVVGIIENMSFLELPDGSRVDIFGAGGGERLSQWAGVPFIGAVPIDPQVRSGGDTGKPVVIEKPESAVGKALRSVAERIAAQISVAASQASTNFIPIQMVD
jgi:ATP-binding protein involved in chromosome partitioning